MSCIAIHEKDNLMRALLEEWLHGAGYRVRGLAPPKAQAGGAVDLVILGVSTPKREGAALIRAAQAIHPQTPLIAISGHFRPGLSSFSPACRTLGVARLMAQPLTREGLLEAVREVIGSPS